MLNDGDILVKKTMILERERREREVESNVYVLEAEKLFLNLFVSEEKK